MHADSNLPHLAIENDPGRIVVRFPETAPRSETLAEIIRRELLGLEVAPGQTLILDVRGIEWMNGESLALLLKLRSRLHQARGRLMLRRPSELVLSALRITRLDRVLEVEDPCQVALPPPIAERIEERAYELWQHRGPDSDPLRNWLDAEGWLTPPHRGHAPRDHASLENAARAGPPDRRLR